MDTSGTYIKMCDTPEIQGLWKPDWHDIYAYGVWCQNPRNSNSHKVYIWDEHLEMHIGGVHCPQMNSGEWHGKPIIWLPRQDQLQNMLYIEGKENLVEFRERIISDFSAWCHVLRMANDFRDYLSMEQLWLAFVMKEKFNKV